MLSSPAGCRSGLLVSVEGISGVGKTYLTGLLLGRLPTGQQPVVVPEFSRRRRTGAHDLGRDLLQVLLDAAHGDHFLRGGHPSTETLLLLAIKMHDYEAHAAPALRRGQLVLEGRSIHSTAVYQSLIANPQDDQAAYQHAQAILAVAERWRPLPDLTILLVDDITTALQRAETRDARRYTSEQWRLHRRAAALFQRLAWADPQRVPIVDHGILQPDQAVARMADLITAASTDCLAQPAAPEPGRARCRSG